MDDNSDESENEDWPLLDVDDTSSESVNEEYELLDVIDSSSESVNENQSLGNVIDNVQSGGMHGSIDDSLISICSKNKRIYK